MEKPILKFLFTHSEVILDKRKCHLRLYWEDGDDFGVILAHGKENEHWNWHILDVLRDENLRYDPGYEPGDGATIIMGDREEVLEKLKKHFEILEPVNQ